LKKNGGGGELWRRCVKLDVSKGRGGGSRCFGWGFEDLYRSVGVCDTEGLEVVRVGGWGMLRRGWGRLGCGNMHLLSSCSCVILKVSAKLNIFLEVWCVTRVYSVLYHGILVS